VEKHYDILIVGGGLVGQVTALACAKLQNLSVALVDSKKIFDSKKMRADGRAYALSASSLKLLKHLKIDIAEHLQPMKDMLITDGALGQEPPWRLHFDAESQETAPAQMIENYRLMEAVSDSLLKTKVTILSPAFIENLTHTASGVSGRIGNADITADLLVAADGVNSPIRQKAGIITDGRDYHQSALVATIAHALPHDGLALQRFLPGGPLAVLPLKGNRSQIVWSDKTSAIKAACGLAEADFLSELSFRIGDHLGEIKLTAPRQSYPLRLQLAQDYVAQRLVLIGDAAHVIHPLAGQGLNLGLRDVAVLFDVLKAARLTGRDIGGAALGEYAAWRKSDVTSLAAATDGLSYAYNSPRGFIRRPAKKLFDHVRRLGLSALNENQTAKDIISKDAAGELGQRPTLLM
jgi:2-octaprenyl-6-methoxyphenol hydroxylase